MLLTLITAAAGEGAPSAPIADVVRAEQSVRIDGRLDDPDWERAPVVSRFTRYLPTPGGAPTGRTEVRFLQDDRHLYVGVRVSEADYRLRARISPRESIDSDDQIGIYLDTFDDGMSGYIFYFNALGIQQDIRYNAGSWNMSWDTLLRSRGRLTDDGFELEVAFPWRSLKFGRDVDAWRVLVTRKIPEQGAKYAWPGMERGAPRIFAHAGRLEGVAPPARGSGLELIPSLTASRSAIGAEPPADSLRPSLDARWGITPDLGLAGTLNPDFSQVENDVSDVRLNARFAFQFPEQRPFFLDGVDLFQDRAGTLYTRTMNAPVYGVKISGREGPWSLGALHVLDARPIGSFTEGGTRGFDAADVEGALASSTLVRARTDAFGLGYAGITLGDKRILGGATHQIAGVDLEVPLGDRWFGATSLQHSLTGDDDDRRWGTEQRVDLWRASGLGTGGRIAALARSAAFRRELGYLTQADLVWLSGSIDHTFMPARGVDTFTPAAWVEATEEGNGDAYRTAGVGQTTLFGGVHTVSTRAWGQWFLEGDADVRGAGGSLGYAGNLGRTLDLSASAAAGRGIDFALGLPADDVNLTTTVTLRPTAGIRNDTTLALNTHTPKGRDLQLRHLVRNRLNWQFDRALGLRWVLDRTGGTERAPRTFNALLITWLRNPGTAVWLGASLGTEAGSGVVEQTLFAKATLLIRP